ncbi:hypothetical protein ACGFX8_35245 [Streptomyces sp. NPDC048362]|uniref:hypothetical protein n=1 Tax=Streptomyces sp. NPDC048362 TaxID=3365539 RepID=UPI00370FDC91
MIPEVLHHRAFTVTGGRTFTWADVVAAAQFWGEWGEAEAAASMALKTLWRARAVGVDLGGATVDESARQFRYQRQLLSADELQSWLAFRGLDVDSWLNYIRGRALLGERVDGDSVADPDEIPHATWAQLVCSGALERVGQRLATYLAVADALSLPAAQTPLCSSELASLEHAYAKFSGGVDDAKARRELERRQVEWTRVQVRQLSCKDEHVVREVALCVRTDGRPIDDVAIEAGASIERRRFEIQHVDEPLRSKLLGARVGELLGPLPHGADQVLVEVIDKHPPSFDDPQLARRARACALERALLSEVAERISFDELP